MNKKIITIVTLIGIGALGVKTGMDIKDKLYSKEKSMINRLTMLKAKLDGTMHLIVSVGEEKKALDNTRRNLAYDTKVYNEILSDLLNVQKELDMIMASKPIDKILNGVEIKVINLEGKYENISEINRECITRTLKEMGGM